MTTAQVKSNGGRWTGWPISLGLGLIALIVYLANGRDIGTEDTHPGSLVPHSIARGAGLDLQRFRETLIFNGKPLASVAWKRGCLVTRFPIAPGLIAAPLVWPQRWFCDYRWPGWRDNPIEEWRFALNMAKHAAALMTAAAVVCTHRLLCSIGLGGGACFATLAAAFASGFWTTASQALWQHGPAVLALALAMLLLSSGSPISRGRHAGAGACAGLLCAVRLVDVIFAGTMVLWLVRTRPRILPWFFVGMTPVAALTVAHNVWWFSSLVGGQAELDSLHPAQHAIPGPWTLNLGPGMAGTLFSPSRGLFVFMPWTLLALMAYPRTRREAVGPGLAQWLVWSLIPYLVALSAYGVWWGGFCYGPRYWTDAVPILAVVLACTWQWARRRATWLQFVLVLSVVWSFGLQALGAFCYPSSWNLGPPNVDLRHERLWDWGDTEVERCINEKLFKRK